MVNGHDVILLRNGPGTRWRGEKSAFKSYEISMVHTAETSSFFIRSQTYTQNTRNGKDNKQTSQCYPSRGEAVLYGRPVYSIHRINHVT